ncbi:TerD family protein [Dysgonomonas sp. 216]|uniref:TerD family protein n=1 Tax=Dysgonomonas sp. 216 TaxID=2302934 RepID=UPI0013D02603|nr:TerD family protein [Dysgonomonas sp. 216]NDW19750.1 TerD family protein [Dysgonomonas sp. 216]
MAHSLIKGQRVNLEKVAGTGLTNFSIGVSWGGILNQTTQKKFLGLRSKTINETIIANLDLNCAMFNTKGTMVDHIYSPVINPELLLAYGLPEGKLVSDTQALEYRKDNHEIFGGKVINVDLTKLGENVERIFFFLNCSSDEDFSQIPYVKTKIFENASSERVNVYSEFNVTAQPRYVKSKTLIVGEIYRKGSVWRFNAIGDVLACENIGETIQSINKHYLI